MSSDIVVTGNKAPALVSSEAPRMKGNPYFAYLATQGSTCSVINIRCRLNGYAKFMGASSAEVFDWSQLTYMSMLAYRKYLQNRSQVDPGKKDLKIGSINTIMTALKGIAETCETMNVISVEQAKAIRKIKQLRYYRIPAGRALSHTESKELLQEPDANDMKGVRDKAIIGLMLGCGLRREEVGNLLFENIDFGRNSIKLIGKGNKQRSVFFTAPVRLLLLNWIQYRGKEDGYLFGKISRGKRVLRNDTPLHPNSIHNIIKEYWAKASDDLSEGENSKPEKISPHDLRRTFATRLFANGTDIVLVQHLMGHASVTTTAQYDRRGEDEMQKAMQNYEL